LSSPTDHIGIYRPPGPDADSDQVHLIDAQKVELRLLQGALTDQECDVRRA
jgi:hypothetical protein